MTNMQSHHYTETQRFWNSWYVILAFVILTPVWSELYHFFQSGQYRETINAESLDLIISVSTVVLILFLLYFMRLVTELRDDGLYYRLAPLQRKFRHTPFDEIESFEVVTYRPIREYGGWGIRHRRNGKAYNVSGTKGIKFHLPNGKHLLIGSHNTEQFECVLHSLHVKRIG